jgi:hypothetical protein
MMSQGFVEGMRPTPVEARANIACAPGPLSACEQCNDFASGRIVELARRFERRRRIAAVDLCSENTLGKR